MLENAVDFNRGAWASLDHSGGQMGERIQAYDWAATPLGAMGDWPQSLRTVANILLSSRYAMWMFWGPEMRMLYNDAYVPTLGIKHPSALGRRTREVWAEIWPEIGPRIETVLTTGKATYDEGLLLFLERSGFPEETYHTFSYSPLADEDGRVCGMLCVVTEETERLIGARRVETLRDVAAAVAGTNTEEEVLRALRQVLTLNQKDLPFTLTYLFAEDGTARLACSSGIASNHPLAVDRIEANANFPWPAQQVFVHPAPGMMIDLSAQRQPAVIPAGDWNKPAERAAIVPIRQQGQERPAGFFIAGINPYRHYGAAYRGFIDLLSGQVAAALSNARAYAAERRRAEALAEIDRAKTTFFSNISHELRTPLTLMLGPVEELLANDRSVGESELLSLVHRNGLRLQKLVNSLLDFSRIEAGRMQAVFEALDLAKYTAELAANFKSAMERAGLQLEICCEAIPHPVYVDREMWDKIVLNLLSNALKFTFAGGVRISLRSRGAQVEMEVEDTGTGIAPSELPHIFERFHRVQGSKGRTIEGTGIGLALVQELVKLHSGTISVRSELGKGSSFTVSIPMERADLPTDDARTGAVGAQSAFVEEAMRWVSSAARSSIETLDDGGKGQAAERILLAEDNADMREYVTRLLGERFQVTAAGNGEEALAAALADPPDLILSDVMMPGLDGFGLLAELRKRPETRTIPVILLSARAGEESRVEGLGAGADDYLIKPFTARELLARVGAHLSMSKRREEAEERIRRSNEELRRANAELEQFAYTASHDLQEPLRQVAIFSQLLEKRFGSALEPKALEYLAYCVEGAQRMETLIRDLLAYSQVAKGGVESTDSVDVNRVLEEVKKNLATAIEQSGARIDIQPLPRVYGDRAPLTHLFQNLVSNALKYRSDRVPEVRITAADDGLFWRFCVRDNGIGIPAEFRAHIFGIFKRLHDRKAYPGTGIGLAICQKIVERYGGRIWVESVVGQGSEFAFTLPKESRAV